MWIDRRRPSGRTLPSFAAPALALLLALQCALGVAVLRAQVAPPPEATAAPAEPVAQDPAENPTANPVTEQGPSVAPDTLPELGGAEGEPDPEKEQRHGLLYSLAAAGLHDDGFQLEGETVKGNAYLVRGALLYDARPSARSSFVLAYEPEAELFDQGQSNLNAVNHAAGALYDVEISRRSHFTAGGSFLRAEDPTRYLGGALLFVPDGTYQQGRVYTGIDRRWQHTTLALHVEGTATEIASWPDFVATDLRDREVSSTLTLEHGFGDRTTVGLSYSYLRPELTGVLDGPARETLFDQPLQTAILMLTRRFGQHWSATLSGGALRQRRVEIDPIDDRTIHPVAALEVIGRGHHFAVEARVERAPLSIGFNPAATPGLASRASIPAAILPGRFVRSASTDLVLLLPRGFRYRQGLWAARTDLRDGGALTSWGASSRVVKALTERMGLFGELEYYRQGPFDRRRFLVGVEFGLLGPRQAISLDRDTDPRRRALPETRGN